MNRPSYTCRSLGATLFIIVLILAAYVAAVRFGHAEPPPGAHDPAISKWFRDQKQPGTGYICCSIADGRPVVTRSVGGHLEAFVDRKSFGPSAPNAWLEIPENVIIRGIENPNGEPILFFYQGEIRCFVDGGQG